MKSRDDCAVEGNPDRRPHWVSRLLSDFVGFATFRGRRSTECTRNPSAAAPTARLLRSRVLHNASWYPRGLLAFVTSLPHPVNCASYPRRSDLLASTLASILRQTHDDFRIVVVVNEMPVGTMPTDPRIEYVSVDYPPPRLPVGRPFTASDLYADKGAKLAVGAAVATRSEADYIMFVDSDDFISRRLAEFVANSVGEPGWYSDTGYFHIRRARTVTPVLHGFHQRNGSTHILRSDLVGVPADLDLEAPRDLLIERVGAERVRSLMGDHKWIVSFFADQGTPLAPLPFPAAIWEIGTGENFSQVLTAAGSKAPVAGHTSDEFGLPVPSRRADIGARLSSFKARITTRVVRRFDPIEAQRKRLQDAGPDSATAASDST